MTITAEMIARQIARRCFDPWTPGHDSLALARRINAGQGWTFETSAPLGGVVRTEVAGIDDALLVEAHAYAVAHEYELI